MMKIDDDDHINFDNIYNDVKDLWFFLRITEASIIFFVHYTVVETRL